MNHSESHIRQGQWVRSNTTPGLWSHPTGYWYFDKSQLMAYYDNNAKQWRLYDHFQKQWYEYSANVFFGQNPVVKGTRQQAAEEIVYEPLPLYSETTFALLTKVEPLANQLRLNVNNDPSVTKPIMDNIFNEINAIAGKFTNIGDPVASLLNATLIDLIKLKDYADPALDFSRITDDTIKTMEVIAPAFEIAVPVFYQMRAFPWLAASAAALAAALLSGAIDNAIFIRNNGWKMAYCYDKSPNNWSKIETCLKGSFQLGAEDIKYCVVLLQTREKALQFAIDRGWYTPKKRGRNYIDRHRETASMFCPYGSSTLMAHLNMLCNQIENNGRNQQYFNHYGSRVQMRQKMITRASLQNFSAFLRQVPMPLASQIADYMENNITTPIASDELVKQLNGYFLSLGMDSTYASIYAQQMVNLITTKF